MTDRQLRNRMVFFFALLLPACEWEPDLSQPIPLRLIDMTDHEIAVFSEAAELWREACGRHRFDLVSADEAPDAVNARVVDKEGGSYDAVGDRAYIEVARDPFFVESAAHELGHVLIGGTWHSSDPRSLMRMETYPGTVITDEDKARGCK